MGKGNQSTPANVDPNEIAQKNLQSHIENDPRSAQLSYDILANPQYGAQATTQLYENIRKALFPQETALREQAVGNIGQALASPTGYTPEQQRALDTRRNQAQTELSRVLRERSNLGGNLYGGRSFQEEGQATADLQNQFAVEDISRQDQQRQQALQNAQMILGLLYPQVGIQTPQYQSSVVDPNTAYQGQINQNQFAAQQAAQEQARKNALYSALLQGVGTAAGGYFGGPAGAAAGGQAGAKFGSSI